ncbi:hypothetical protein CAJAP_01634 [Camponotus japonicus]
MISLSIKRMYVVIDGYVNAHAERRISSHQGIVYRKLDEEEDYYQILASRRASQNLETRPQATTFTTRESDNNCRSRTNHLWIPENFCRLPDCEGHL